MQTSTSSITHLPNCPTNCPPSHSCYRALFPCKSPSAWSTASSFCATITSGANTATNYPTRATSACGTAPARYISACACGSTCTPTPVPCPSLGLIPNGDFECDLASWTVQVPDPAATPSIVTPGNTGAKAFQAHLGSSPVSPELGVSARIISETVPVTVGAPATLTFSTFFTEGTEGFIGVQINGSPVLTIDAHDRPVGVWNGFSLDYTPTSESLTVMFEFLFDAARASTGDMRVDGVGFYYLG
jgi:hypothetical protein